MYDQLISNALQQLCFGDDLTIELEDHIRRMSALEAECPLDLASTIDFTLPMDTLDQRY